LDSISTGLGEISDSDSAFVEISDSGFAEISESGLGIFSDGSFFFPSSPISYVA
jgi:hypothetical protein